MKNTHNLQVGQTWAYRPNDHHGEPLRITIAKVGTAFAYSNELGNLRIRLDSLKVEFANFGQRGQLLALIDTAQVSTLNTDCTKCKAPMPTAVKARHGLLSNMPMLTTAYVCPACDHYNDLTRRKGWREHKSAWDAATK